MSSRQLSVSFTKIFPVILFLGLLGMTARAATDPDLWWHLRTGQWIVETGHVPHSDPFSFTRAGHPWIAHEWLSDVLFFELWKHGGTAALIIFAAIITASGFMLLYWRCSAPAHWAAAATVLGALAAAPSWGVRPQMFTFTFVSLLLWLIERGELRAKLLLWIPPLLLFWLNLHAGFALAPVLLLAYGAGLSCEIAFGNVPWIEARPLLLRVLALLFICLALVPLNPSGFHLYRYPFDTVFSPGMRSFIVEWTSPDFHQWLYRPLLLLWLLLIVVLVLDCSGLKVKGRMILPLLFTAFASLDAVRHIPIFVLLAVPIVAAGFSVFRFDQREKISPMASRTAKPSKFRPILAIAAVILMAAFAMLKWVSLIRNQADREAELFPEKAIAMLKTGDYSRDLFVYYDWGGYVIWKLFPKYRVFVDGRADLYGDDLLHQFKTVTQLGNGWHDILERWKIDTLVVPPSSAVAQALLLSPQWHVDFHDSQAVIFSKSAPIRANLAFPPSEPSRRTNNKIEKKFPESRRICETMAHAGR